MSSSSPISAPSSASARPSATSDRSAPTAASVAVVASSLCPFHDGRETLDGLLAELAAHETGLLDAALDLRSAMADGTHADTCVELAVRVRDLLDGRHYLAFYRLRRWLRRTIRVQARLHRGEAWQTFVLPPDFARVDEIVHTCEAQLATGTDAPPETVQVRFIFTRAPLAASVLNA